MFSRNGTTRDELFDPVAAFGESALNSFHPASFQRFLRFRERGTQTGQRTEGTGIVPVKWGLIRDVGNCRMICPAVVAARKWGTRPAFRAICGIS